MKNLTRVREKKLIKRVEYSQVDRVTGIPGYRVGGDRYTILCSPKEDRNCILL